MNIGNMAKGMNDVHSLIDAIIQTAASEGEEGREEYSLDMIRMKNELREKYSALQQQLAAAREALQAADADAARYRWLRDSSSCSLTINHNDHHCMYQSVADTMDDTQGYYEDVSNDEKTRMIATDSIWTIHEYPNTPVGFNVYHAATLDAAIDEAMAASHE